MWLVLGVSTVPAEGFTESVRVGHRPGTAAAGGLPGSLQLQKAEKVS